MRPQRSILLVEDNVDHVGTWIADVEEFNGDDAKPFRIDLLHASTLKQARVILEKSHIDAAIVDLRIPRDVGLAAGAETGNEVLKEVVETISGPTAIFSAHAGEAGGFVANTPIRVSTKNAGESKAIIDWFCEHARLMTAIGLTVSDIRRETARVFSGMIWRRWGQTKNLDLKDDELRQVVTRQVVAHIGEQLSLPLNNAPDYHPLEFYFEPPLRADRLHTGDLLKLEDGVHVILTAQCDMVRDYPEKILLAKCKGLDWGATKDKKKFATQNHSLKSHFLPACGEKGPWTAEFRSLTTISGADAQKYLATRFASIAPQFVPNLVHRFATFVGRIGQPELKI